MKAIAQKVQLTPTSSANPQIITSVTPLRDIGCNKQYKANFSVAAKEIDREELVGKLGCWWRESHAGEISVRILNT